jgi:hypothetical protein
MRTCAILLENAKIVNINTIAGIVMAVDRDARIRVFRVGDIKSEDEDKEWIMNEDLDPDEDEE